MYIFKKVKDLQQHIQNRKSQNKIIGFVPTMGALHAGHLSLIARANAETDITVCSIFVNPTQFDNQEDLVKYPKTIEQDIELLIKNNTNILFLPSIKEVYPDTLEKQEKYDLGGLDLPMEGAFRAGHFDGVVQVVKRLLDIVQPDQLFMGQKDYQQFKIIGRLLSQIKSDIKLVRCPIMREADGLAMSSRNVRLTAEERQKAVTISQTLKLVKQAAEKQEKSILELEKKAIETIEKVEGMKVEYFKIVDATTLQEVENWQTAPQLIACTAVYLGAIRLIDNILL